MSFHRKTTLALGLLLSAHAGAQAPPTDDPVLNRAYNDHIAYVLSFMLPEMSARCAALSPDYVQTVAPRYLRFMADQQPRIERGRLLTMAELDPAQTLASYREDLVRSRTGQFEAASAEGKARTCAGIAAVVAGQQVPGEWPARK
ncbi:MAG: hypothetical protein V4704_05770 [Pseudomonadota bacterium]